MLFKMGLRFKTSLLSAALFVAVGCNTDQEEDYGDVQDPVIELNDQEEAGSDEMETQEAGNQEEAPDQASSAFGDSESEVPSEINADESMAESYPTEEYAQDETEDFTSGLEQPEVLSNVSESAVEQDELASESISDSEPQQLGLGLPSSPVAETPVQNSGDFREYRVRFGETLSQISQKIYGDRQQWRTIAEFNQIRNPNLIFPSQTIRIQIINQKATDFFANHSNGANNPMDAIYANLPLNQLEVASSPASEAAIAEEDEMVDEEAPSIDQVSTSSSRSQSDSGADMISVTVGSGDTLSAIASRSLGSEKLWFHIWHENRGSIANPDKIAVGQVLRFPRASMAD
jgi:nucleoid-associated protein YgaU